MVHRYSGPKVQLFLFSAPPFSLLRTPFFSSPHPIFLFSAPWLLFSAPWLYPRCCTPKVHLSVASMIKFHSWCQNTFPAFCDMSGHRPATKAGRYVSMATCLETLTAGCSLPGPRSQHAVAPKLLKCVSRCQTNKVQTWVPPAILRHEQRDSFL